MFVHLTEAQYRNVLANGTLGQGYTGWRSILGFPFSEGRIWATRYAADELKGVMGVVRALSVGINPFRLPQMVRSIQITGEAAAAFSRPAGAAFSLNPIGWLKGIIGNQFQFRGTLPFSGGSISSLAGAGNFTPWQMAVLRAGEIERFLGYAGLTAAAYYAVDRLTSR